MVKHPSFLNIYIIWALIVLAGCGTNVDILTPDFESLPIIYAVINPYDSVQSVRIERSFRILDEKGARLQDSDSLYYDSVSVNLSGLAQGRMIWRNELIKNYIEKDSGNFTGQNHHVYCHFGKLDIPLVGNSMENPGTPGIDELLITVAIPDIGKTVVATAPVFSPVFVLNNGRQSKDLCLYGNNSTVFSLYAVPGKPGVMYEGQEIRFYVQIEEYASAKHQTRLLEWYTSQGFIDGYRMTPERFYNRLMMGLAGSDSVEARVIKNIDVEMTLSAITFGEYVYRSNFEGVIDQPFTSMDGALGVFTTKSKGKLSGLTLDRTSLDSLCNSPKWKHLRFVHWD